MKKNKKTTIIIVILAVITILIAMFLIFNKTKKDNKDISLKHLKLELTTMAMGAQVYEVTLDNDEVLFESYYDRKFSDDINDKSDRDYARSFIGTSQQYEELIETLKACNVRSWKEYHGTNSMVLDGGGFRLSIELEDNELIEADGMNAYPENFSEFKDKLIDIIDYELIKSTKFNGKELSLTLPEKWINKISIKYDTDYYSFRFKDENINETCFVLYVVDYTIDGDDYIYVADIKDNNDNIKHIYYKINNINYYKNKLNDEQLTLFYYIDNDVIEIINSIKVNDSYTLIEKEALMEEFTITKTEIEKGRKYTFSRMLVSVEDLEKLDISDEYTSACAIIFALARYESNPDEAIKMLEFINGPEDVSKFDTDFIKNQMNQYPYVVRSYFEGATVDNNYEIKEASLTIKETPYSRDEEGYVKLYLHSAGADSDRGITLRLKGSTNQWFLFSDTYKGILSGIRQPKSEDKWS